MKGITIIKEVDARLAADLLEALAEEKILKLTDENQLRLVGETLVELWSKLGGEAKSIEEDIQRIIEEGVSPSDIALLFQDLSEEDSFKTYKKSSPNLLKEGKTKKRQFMHVIAQKNKERKLQQELENKSEIGNVDGLFEIGF